MAAFVARHHAHQRLDVGVLDVLLDLVVQHAAGELAGDAAHQEVEEFLAQLGADAAEVLLQLDLELGVALEVVVIVVALVLGHHRVPLGTHRRHVEPVERLVVGGVEARGQQRFRGGLLHRLGAHGAAADLRAVVGDGVALDHCGHGVSPGWA
jgi:hypothetical protein